MAPTAPAASAGVREDGDDGENVVLFSVGGRIRMTAGATSKPRFASGGYSVYRRMALSKSYVRTMDEDGGTEMRSSS